MKNIKKGDVVARKSYGKDILFNVKKIISIPEGDIAILSGVMERIEADSNVDDLEKIEETEIKKNMKNIDKKLEERIKNKQEKSYNIGIVTTKNKRLQQKIVTGKILHLDGEYCFVNTKKWLDYWV